MEARRSSCFVLRVCEIFLLVLLGRGVANSLSLVSPPTPTGKTCWDSSAAKPDARGHRTLSHSISHA